MSKPCVKVLEKDMKTLSKNWSILENKELVSIKLKDSHRIILAIYTIYTQLVFIISHLLGLGLYTQSTPTTITTSFKYKE
jgi:hypothetical protein